MLDSETFARAVAERPTFALLPYFEDGTFDFMPDEAYLPFHYNALTGKELNLEYPSTFDEKIAWIKLHDRKPHYRDLADKLRVRPFVTEHLGADWLVPLIGTWDTPEEIDFDILPDRFVLKCTHGHGGVVVCRDKASLDKDAAVARLRKAYDRDYFSPAREWAYSDPVRHVIAEEFIDDGGEKPADYRFFCMNGQAMLVSISRAVNAAHEDKGYITFFLPDGTRTPFKRADYPEFPGKLRLPASWGDMLFAAEHLAEAADAPFVRVDFYEMQGIPYFSEFTFYPCGGTMFLEPEEYGLMLGNLLDLPVDYAEGEC